MILADTSIWIDYFRNPHKAGALGRLLEEGQAALHPWVYAELTLGHLGPKRLKVLADLRLLPTLTVSPLEEVLSFIEQERLQGQGLGWVDVELLYSTLTGGLQLWTHDRALLRAAKLYRCSFFG